MKTYCFIVAAAITLIFASAASATPRPQDHFGSNERGGHHQQSQHGNKHDNKHDNRDGRDKHVTQRVDRRGNDYKRNHDNYREGQHSRPSKHYTREVHKERHVEHYYHQDAYSRHEHHGNHRSHSDVNWLINVDLGPYYDYSPAPVYPAHAIYYERHYDGQCFRVEERVDRKVWIEVPYYKCN